MNKQNDTNTLNIYIFLGPPGAGKGSLSQLCVKKLGWRQLSTGNLCREHIAQGTQLGQQIDFTIKSGKLIADDVIFEMVDDWLTKQSQQPGAVIFDGFPRTLNQAKALHELIDSYEGVDLHVVRLTIADEELMYRLLARSICKNDKCQKVYSLHKHSAQKPRKETECDDCASPLMRRSDDEQVAISDRLKIYHEHEQALLDFYRHVGRPINTIDVDMPLEEVYTRLLTFIQTQPHDEAVELFKVINNGFSS